MIGPVALTLLLAGGSHPAGVRWERDFDAALRKARASGKPLMVDFWAEWCGWCHRLDQTTYLDPEVVRRAANFVAVKVDTEGSSQEAEIANRYDVNSLPTIVFLSPSGRQVLRLGGFQGPGQFPSTMDEAREIATRILRLETNLERNPADPGALLGLGLHLFEQESYEESRDLLARATKFDSHAGVVDRKKARMVLGIIQYYDHKYPEAEGWLKQALALPTPSEDDPRILYVLGRTYLAAGRYAEARTTLQSLVDGHAQSPLAQKARDTLVALERK